MAKDTIINEELFVDETCDKLHEAISDFLTFAPISDLLDIVAGHIREECEEDEEVDEGLVKN